MSIEGHMKISNLSKMSTVVSFVKVDVIEIILYFDTWNGNGFTYTHVVSKDLSILTSKYLQKSVDYFDTSIFSFIFEISKQFRCVHMYSKDVYHLSLAHGIITK